MQVHRNGPSTYNGHDKMADIPCQVIECMEILVLNIALGVNVVIRYFEFSM
jgi:hypothetical protein